MEDNDIWRTLFMMWMSAKEMQYPSINKPWAKAHNKFADRKRLHLSLTQKLLGIIFKPQIPHAG
jgi:hypothetical protein